MRRVVGDLEGDGLLDTLTTIWCGVFKDIDTNEVFKFTPDNLYDIRPFLDSCSVVIGHNFLDYDVPALSRILGYEFAKECVIIDTYILSQMISPDRKKHPALSGKKGPHSLENFGLIFGRKKPEHEDWSKFSEDMLHRCSEDVEINHMAFQLLNRKARIFDPKSKWFKPYQIEAAFAACLVKQKERGVLFDRLKAEEFIKELSNKIATIDHELIPKLPKIIKIKEQKKDGQLGYNKIPFKGNGELNQRTMDWCTAAGVDPMFITGPFSRIEFLDFDLGSIKLVKEYLLDQGWIPDQWNTKKDPVTGEVRRTSPKLTKEDEFIGVTGDVGQKVAERMVYRHRRSQLEGFLKIIRGDGRITADVSGITPTARLKHKGVVNIPGEEAIFGKEMREVFIAPEGYEIVGCDAASCQLRMLCHYMDDEEYTKAVIFGNKEDGTDIHSVNMEKTGIVVRKVAKNFIYGFLFGAGAAKIGAILGTGKPADGKRLKAKFLKEFPKLKALLDKVELEFNQYGYITGLDGREIYPRSLHECLCYLLQSAEAILMKVATLYLHKWIQQENLDAHMVLHMHDEYQIETLKGDVPRVMELSEKAIVQAGKFLKLNVPTAGEAAHGINWSQTH